MWQFLNGLLTVASIKLTSVCVGMKARLSCLLLMRASGVHSEWMRTHARGVGRALQRGRVFRGEACSSHLSFSQYSALSDQCRDWRLTIRVDTWPYSLSLLPLSTLSIALSLPFKALQFQGCCEEYRDTSEDKVLEDRKTQTKTEWNVRSGSLCNLEGVLTVFLLVCTCLTCRLVKPGCTVLAFQSPYKNLWLQSDG